MRELLSGLGLSLLLLLTQQGALLHELCHAAATQAQQDGESDPAAAAEPCAVCLAFSALATGVAAGVITHHAVVVRSDHGVPARTAQHAALDWPFRHSRGPPAEL